MKIITVFKTHFDIGFTELSAEVIKNYGEKMLEDVLVTCEQTQSLGEGLQFVWTMSAWPLLRSLENCTPERKKRAEALIERGQLCCHALPYTTHTEFLNSFQTERLFDYAHEFSEKYGRPFPRAAKMTDVPGHTMGLIKPLVDNGVKFLHLGCNPASTFPDVPLMFWWENHEGQRVLTFYNSTYGSSNLPPKGWKFPVWLSMQQSNDNVGPQSPSVVTELKNQAESALPGVDFKVGTLEDFYDEIIKCDLSGLPVIRKDLGDTWIQGIGTYPKEVSMLRRARPAETAGMSEEDMREYLENALLFGEHTWGMDIKTHLTWQRSYPKAEFLKERNSERYLKVEESWNEQRRRARRCAEIAAKYLPKEAKEPQRCLEDENYKLEIEKGRLMICDKKAGVSIYPEYEYRVIGTDEITEFMRRYLTRFYEWAIADFGRQSYGEVEGKKFKGRFTGGKTSGGRLVLTYEQRPETYGDYGNCKTVEISGWIENGKVHVSARLPGKQASPYVESGDFFFRTDLKGGPYLVNKTNCVLDCSRDIVRNANTVMWSVDKYAQIGGVRIEPLDSPLVSFGESAVYKFNGGNFKTPKRNDFVFNLFNNMWGTNFPQWTEGDFEYEFVISQAPPVKQ